MTLHLRNATEADLGLLAHMNYSLIEDEGSRNPMTLEQLRRRMEGMLHGDWKIDLFMEDEATVGYAVYQFRPDSYFPEKTTVFLRHFYIERGYRRRGVGRVAFDLLAEARFPPDCTIELEVLDTNPNGYRFWTYLGFAPYCTTMHLPYRRAPDRLNT